MRLYLESSVTPALDAIDDRLDELLRTDEPAAVFQVADVMALRNSPIQAFALSVQSQWERQLRGFLKDCASEFNHSAVFVEALEKANWAELLKRFQELRGLPLQAFDSFPDLDLLRLLGNACRHGDGNSARMLYERYPELWPNWPPALSADWAGPALPNVSNHPPFSQVCLSRSRLVRLTDAVIWFWRTTPISTPTASTARIPMLTPPLQECGRNALDDRDRSSLLPPWMSGRNL